MSYTAKATSRTPALIIYLLDVSRSMGKSLGSRTRIKVVEEAIEETIQEMVYRSTKGALISPRYRVAIYAYSDKVYDIYQGVQTIDRLANIGIPELKTVEYTDTVAAFREAERLLERELPKMREADAAERRRNPDAPDLVPAPLVCHMTDAESNTENPEPVAQRIMQMEIDDGHVLVENIFISDSILARPIRDIKAWPGIADSAQVAGEQAARLLRMSSPLPLIYRANINEQGYNLDSGSRMLFPGTSSEMVKLGFQASASTRVK